MYYFTKPAQGVTGVEIPNHEVDFHDHRYVIYLWTINGPLSTIIGRVMLKSVLNTILTVLFFFLEILYVYFDFDYQF